MDTRLEEWVHPSLTVSHSLSFSLSFLPVSSLKAGLLLVVLPGLSGLLFQSLLPPPLVAVLVLPILYHFSK